MHLKLLACLFVAALGCRGGGEAESQRTDTTKQAADNTGRNERDRGSGAVTPMNQGESEQDITITQQVRQDVVGNDALSTSAKNVKIITAEGVVTLRGPVTSAQEKTEVGQLAKNVSGVKRVDNQLEIAAK